VLDDVMYDDYIAVCGFVTIESKSLKESIEEIDKHYSNQTR